MKFITTIFSVLFSLSIQAQLVTYPGTLSTGMPHNDDYTCLLYTSPSPRD